MAEREISALNCIEHPKLLINYFCLVHDTVFCENCRAELHQSCNDVKSIKDACKNDANGRLISELVDRTSEAKEELSLMTDKLEDNLSVLDRQYNNIKENIKNARKSFTNYLDFLESNLTELVHDRCIKSVEERLVELEWRKYTLEQWDDELQAAIRSGDEEILFSTLKILHTLQNDMESYLSDTQHAIKVTNVRWTPIRTDPSSVAAFIGSLSLTETSSSLLGTPRSARPSVVRESSVNSRLSVGTINFVQDSRVNKGLDCISSRTEEGYNEISSKVQDESVTIVENEEASTKGKSTSRNQAVLNGLVVSTPKHSPRRNVEQHSTEIPEVEKVEQNGSHQSADDVKNPTSPSGTKSQLDVTLSISPSTKRTDACFPKFKLEAADLDVGTEIDKGLFISNSELLFLDKQNRQIFICKKEGKVENKINLHHKPQDLCLLDHKTAVVTLGHVGVQIVNIKTCKKEKYHDVGGYCSTVASFKGQLIVSVDNKLRLIDTFGYTLRRIQHEGSAHFITTDNNGRIYFSDSLNHMIYCIAWYGVPVFVFSSHELRYPMGIILDASGFLYIAGFESNNIIKLSPNGRYHSTFICEKGELYEPSDLDYNRDTGELLVVRDSHLNVEIYDTNQSVWDQK